MQQQYTYEDWRFGHVVLFQSCIIPYEIEDFQLIFSINGKYPSDVLSDLQIRPQSIHWQNYLHQTIVDWTSFSIKETERIKSEQNHIYQSVIDKLFLEFTSNYLIRKSNSIERDKLIEIEFEQSQLLLFGDEEEIIGVRNTVWNKSQNMSIYDSVKYSINQRESVWNDNFRKIDIRALKKYFKMYYLFYIVNGNPVDTSFINSPIFGLNENQNILIQCAVCYKYHKWLEKEKESNEGVNPHPRIFTSFFAFQIFKAYFEKHLRKNHLHADISYLYYKMKGDYSSNTKYIHSRIQHSEFIKFCEDHLRGKLENKYINSVGALLQLKKNPNEPIRLKSQFTNLEKEFTLV